jgi:hypothetical protein
MCSEVKSTQHWMCVSTRFKFGALVSFAGTCARLNKFGRMRHAIIGSLKGGTAGLDDCIADQKSNTNEAN